jgi:hypothetical protein
LPTFAKREGNMTMDYIATGNFAWRGRTYKVGDAAPGDEGLINLGLVEEVEQEDGPVPGDYEDAEG